MTEVNQRAAELARQREEAAALRLAADRLDGAGFKRNTGPSAWLRAEAARLERGRP